MVTVSGNSNPTNPTYPTNPTNPTNPTTINSGELTDKNQWPLGVFNPLWGLGTMYDVYLRLIGKRVVDFLLVLIELFR